MVSRALLASVSIGLVMVVGIFVATNMKLDLSPAIAEVNSLRERYVPMSKATAGPVDRRNNLDKIFDHTVGDATPQTQESEAKNQATLPPPKEVAVTVLLTTSKKSGNLRSTVDAIRLLKERIRLVSHLTPDQSLLEDKIDIDGLFQNGLKDKTPSSFVSKNEKYHIHFIGLVTPEVPGEWRKALEEGGWEVREKRSPVDYGDVRNQQIAKELVTDGAMGITEMVKVEGFKMKEFHRVLMVDADVFFYKNMEELFETEGDLAWTHGGWDIEWLNGGFLVFNPQSPRADHHYNRLCELLKEGDFRPGSGWKGAGVGWTYGGRTIQGLLPYYFLVEIPNLNSPEMAKNFAELEGKQLEDGNGDIMLSPDSPRGKAIIASLAKRSAAAARGGVHKRSKLPDLHTDQELERCQYNNMVQLDKCKNIDRRKITSNHFTGECQKPWFCPGGRGHKLCQAFDTKWVEFAKAYARNIKRQNYSPCFGGYKPLP